MHNPSISVIIPVFNGENFIAHALKSVLEQSFQDIEVVVVDDGSTDSTPTVVRQFPEKVRYIRQERQGVSASRNKGISISRGKYIAFLDADDVWLPHKLERQIAYFKNNPALGGVGCGFFATDENLNILEEHIPSPCELPDLLLMQRDGGLTSGSRILVPKLVVDRVGGFNTHLSTSADLDFAIRIKMNYEVSFVPEALVLYRQHGSNMHKNISLMEKDMRIVLDTAFFYLPSKEYKYVRRRAYSNLYRALSGSYFHIHEFLHAVRCVLLSALWHPSNIPYILGFFPRRIKLYI